MTEYYGLVGSGRWSASFELGDTTLYLVERTAFSHPEEMTRLIHVLDLAPSREIYARYFPCSRAQKGQAVPGEPHCTCVKGDLQEKPCRHRGPSRELMNMLRAHVVGERTHMPAYAVEV